MSVDRSATARALAKAIAYADCGQSVKAELWAVELVRLLGAAEILSAAALAGVGVAR